MYNHLLLFIFDKLLLLKTSLNLTSKQVSQLNIKKKKKYGCTFEGELIALQLSRKWVNENTEIIFLSLNQSKKN